MRKSQGVQFILAFLFGPIGLFYSGLAAGFAFTIAGVAFVIATDAIAAPLVWIVCVLAGFALVHSHNKKVAVEEDRHREILSATQARTQEPAARTGNQPPRAPEPLQPVETFVTARGGSLTYRVIAYRQLKPEEAQYQVMQALKSGQLVEPAPGGTSTLVTDLGKAPTRRGGSATPPTPSSRPRRSARSEW